MTTSMLKLLIDGQLVDGTSTLEVINPASGAAFASVPCASLEQLEAAVRAAREALPAWSGLARADRADMLRRLADAITAQAENLARALVQEQGKPIADADNEIAFAALFIRYFADLELPIETVQDDDEYLIEVHHRPLGVVAGITPWNFPFLIACYKLAPALLLGNTFILKPAPTTPVTSLMLASLASTIFPRGVVSVIVGENELGRRLTEHPDIAKISFTGSTETGRRVMAAASSTLKRLTLELGGNDAGIVLADADLECTAERVFGSAFMLSGQVCIALKRLYVHSSVYDRMCELLSKLASEAPVGDGLEQGTRIGPLQNKAQFEKAQHYLRIAHRDGQVISGGEVIEGDGYFMRPSIVRDISDGSPLVDEEQFAPILPIIRFEDIDEVIDRVNASQYGLGGSVWSADTDHARSIAKRIDSGTVWINHATHFGPHIPFGGAKQSGIGVEFGRDGLAEFSQRTVISLAKA